MSARHHPTVMTGISLLLPITLSTMAIVLLAPVLPRMLDEFGKMANADYLVPLLLTVQAACITVFSPFAGMLGDYFGRRRLLLSAFLAYAVVGVAPVFLHDFWAIMASRVGVGIAEALIMVLSTTMIGDYYDGAARDRWLAGQTAFASTSALLLMPLGGFLGRYGWRMPFWVYGSAVVMFALVWVYTWEPAETDPDEEADHAPHHASWAGFPWGRMAGIIGITVYGSVLFYTLQIFAPLGLKQLGTTDSFWGGLLAALASVGVPLGTFVYSACRGAPTSRLLFAEFALLTIGFWMMSRAATPTAFLLGGFTNQLGAGMLLPTLLVWTMQGLSFEVRSRGAGMWNGAFSIGQFLCPIVVTLSSAHGSGLFGAFGVLSLGAGLGAVCAGGAMLTARRAAGHG